MSLLGEVQKAYEFFKANQWIQGTMIWNMPTGGTAYCLEGVAYYYDVQMTEGCGNYDHPSTALHAHPSPSYGKVRKALTDTLLDRGLAFPSVIDWNDADGRSKEEVDDLWQETIQRLKKVEESRVPVSA